MSARVWVQSDLSLTTCGHLARAALVDVGACK